MSDYSQKMTKLRQVLSEIHANYRAGAEALAGINVIPDGIGYKPETSENQKLIDYVEQRDAYRSVLQDFTNYANITRAIVRSRTFTDVLFDESIACLPFRRYVFNTQDIAPVEGATDIILTLPEPKEGYCLSFIIDDPASAALTILMKGEGVLKVHDFETPFTYYVQDGQWKLLSNNYDLFFHPSKTYNARGMAFVGKEKLEQFIRARPGETVSWVTPWPVEYKILSSIVSSVPRNVLSHDGFIIPSRDDISLEPSIAEYDSLDIGKVVDSDVSIVLDENQSDIMAIVHSLIDDGGTLASGITLITTDGLLYTTTDDIPETDNTLGSVAAGPTALATVYTGWDGATKNDNSVFVVHFYDIADPVGNTVPHTVDISSSVTVTTSSNNIGQVNGVQIPGTDKSVFVVGPTANKFSLSKVAGDVIEIHSGNGGTVSASATASIDVAAMSALMVNDILYVFANDYGTFDIHVTSFIYNSEEDTWSLGSEKVINYEPPGLTGFIDFSAFHLDGQINLAVLGDNGEDAYVKYFIPDNGADAPVIDNGEDYIWPLVTKSNIVTLSTYVNGSNAFIYANVSGPAADLFELPTSLLVRAKPAADALDFSATDDLYLPYADRVHPITVGTITYLFAGHTKESLLPDTPDIRNGKSVLYSVYDENEKRDVYVVGTKQL